MATLSSSSFLTTGRRQQQQQQAQALLDKILLLTPANGGHPMAMDQPHALREATRQAESLAQASLVTLGDNDDVKQHPLTMTTLLVSDIFESLQSAAAASKSSAVWVAPESFERQTHKYWVEESRLPALLLLASTKAPLLVYGASGLLSTRLADVATNDNDLWSHVAVPVSSIYFDSPNMDLYHARIKRHEGSRLLRVRWYGRTMPRGDAAIFLELKTHHEGWVGDKSVKERVAIPERYMSHFLSSVPWTADEARHIVSLANPDQTEERKREKSVQLLLTMKELVLQYSLRPCVRSVYERVSFQSANSNALRMTVDRNVTLYDETPDSNHNDNRMAGSFSSSSCGSLSSSWCRPDDNIGTGRTFPYTILEIKVAATAAANGSSTSPSSPDHDWGQTWEDSGLIMDAAKFSKFQTGAVAYNREKISMLPYWTAHPSRRGHYRSHKDDQQ
jgi:SPX domain protein involved in polyphosphate accumulation